MEYDTCLAMLAVTVIHKIMRSISLSTTLLFFISFFLHIMSFLVLSKCIDSTLPSAVQLSQSISSYLYTEKAEISKTKQESRLIHKAITDKVPTHINSPPEKKLAQTQAKDSRFSPPLELKGQALNGLLELIHTAIQKQQEYPRSALEMSREGRVSLGFTLFANGSISNLTVLKSSGTKSLDNAALTAIYKAVPFMGVHHYIDKPREYSIDILFKL